MFGSNVKVTRGRIGQKAVAAKVKLEGSKGFKTGQKFTVIIKYMGFDNELFQILLSYLRTYAYFNGITVRTLRNLFSDTPVFPLRPTGLIKVEYNLKLRVIVTN